MTTSLSKLLACALALTSACAGPGAEGPEPVGARAQESVSPNGLGLNGVGLNGLGLNGLGLNGLGLNGVGFNGLGLNGLGLNGSSLYGVGSDGVTYEGAGMVGANLQGLLSDGSTLALRIDAARAARDVWFYTVSYATASGPRPLCGVDALGAPVEAIALAGRWDMREGVPGGGSHIDDPGAFTFACRGAALAKCVELGYEPWSSFGPTSLRDHHQACTRMMRADYCGDGQPGTINGWQINLYDNLAIQEDTESGAAWVFEGKWAADGALCVDEFRALELVASGEVRDCALAKLGSNCAAGGFAGGVLLRNEYNSAGIVGLVRDLVNGSPNTKLADKVEGALGLLEEGFAELATSPPNRLAALDAFEGALVDLKAAVDGALLPAGYGTGLMNRIVGVARFQATAAIDANACGTGAPSQLAEAKKRRDEGDRLRAAGDYRSACSNYKMAVQKAADAVGSPCSP
ncbi:MAG TPA: ADYC domain-containing protein [Polyangiaceae bacterium]|nr:ADYC domain-containing protein [Polyangiaceae bacterium]